MKRQTVSMWRGVMVFAMTLCHVWAQAGAPSGVESHLQRGEKALVEHRYEDAAKAYEAARQLEPGVAEIHARLGLIYFQQGHFQQAVPALRQALKLKPTLPKMDVLLALSLSELGRYKESLPGLESGFRQTADVALRRMSGLQLQRAYTGLRDDSKAVEIALQMSRMYPQDPEVLYHTGQLFGNFAYVTMRKLAQAAPESVWTIQAIGEAQESQGSYEGAIARYRQVIALAPKRPGIHYRLGRVLQLQAQQQNAQAADPAEAITAFERELAIDPTNANAAYELGVVHYRRAEYPKAQGYFETALKHYSDFQEAEVGLARTLLALDKAADAVPHLRRAIALSPEDEVPHYQLSRAFRQLGNEAERQKAMAEFRRLREARSRQEAVLLQRAVTKQDVDAEGSQP